MDLSNFSLYKLNAQTIIKPFDCGDEDLNSFLQEKAVFYSTELLATTFILESDGNIAAFFSIFNDSIKVERDNFVSTSTFKNLLREILPHSKRHLRNLSAIKIGRLAVSNTIQRGGIGKIITSYIIDLAIQHNEQCACKFISVDAYLKSLGFYTKMGFEFFTSKDENEDTRQMYLDLTPLINIKEEIDRIES